METLTTSPKKGIWRHVSWHAWEEGQRIKCDNCGNHHFIACLISRLCVWLCEWGKRERQKQTGGKECNSSLKGQIPRWCMVFRGLMCMWIVEMGVGGERQQNYKLSYHFTEQCEEWGFWVLSCWAHDTILAPFPLFHTQTYIQLQDQQIAFRLMLWVMTRVTHHF